MSIQRPCKPRRASCRGHLWEAVTRNTLRVANRGAERLSRAAEDRLPVVGDHSRVEADRLLAAAGLLHVAEGLLPAVEDRLPVVVAHSLAEADLSLAEADLSLAEGGPSIAHDSRRRSRRSAPEHH